MRRGGFSKKQVSLTSCGPMGGERADVTEDAVLGGRLVLRQPRKGHRVGHDAILLAAACSARPGERLIELGAGIGAAGLAVAYRLDALALTMIEIDPVLAALARDNAERNGLAEGTRVVCLDATTSPDVLAAADISAAAADHVLMNPPFNAAHNPSPDRGRRLAHVGTPDTLRRWIETAAWLLRPAGALTLIWRADALDAALAALADDFGAVGILPIYPKPDAPAIRVLVRAVKQSHAPLALLPGLMLTDATGQPTPAAEAVLRAGGLLALARIE
jgi:tRNA1(Val) A37 N6-methylase TrmN6